MSGQASTFQLTLVASDHPVWSGPVRSAVIPAEAGELGVLPGHEPVMTVIKQGEVRLSTEGGQGPRFTVADGFAAFDDNLLTIAVESCEESTGPDPAPLAPAAGQSSATASAASAETA